MKKIFYSILGIIATILLAGFIVVFFFSEKLIPFMLDQQVKVIQAQAKNSETLLADKENITIFTIGTASPLPGDRVQTGTAIFVNGHFFMFDVGDGVVRRAENMGLPLAQLDGIFITHWHSDHMMDLPSLISRSWLLGRTNDLHLYGPNGTDTLNQAIDQFLHIENQHRVTHHGMETMDISKAKAIPHEFKNVQGGKAIIYQQDGITITAFDVDHEPIEPAVGYVIEYKGKKVVLSGDTKKDKLVLEMSKDADVLIHEVMFMSLMAKMEANMKKQGMERNAKIVHDIQDYHTSPSDVAEIATRANVKKLILNHFAPIPDLLPMKILYKRELKGYDGEIIFSNDGDKFIVK